MSTVVIKKFIEKKISEYVKINKIPIEFEDLIKAYFLRGYEQFGWDQKTLVKKIKNFTSQVKKIEYKKLKKNIAGEANFKEKAIYLDIRYQNTRYLKKYFDYYIDTVFHEVDHFAERETREGVLIKSGVYIIEDGKIKNRLTGLNEINTVIRANKISSSVENEENRENLGRTVIGSGYEEIQYIGTLINASLGITQEEFGKSLTDNPKIFQNVAKSYKAVLINIGQTKAMDTILKNSKVVGKSKDIKKDTNERAKEILAAKYNINNTYRTSILNAFEVFCDRIKNSDENAYIKDKTERKEFLAEIMLDYKTLQRTAKKISQDMYTFENKEYKSKNYKNNIKYSESYNKKQKDIKISYKKLVKFFDIGFIEDINSIPYYLINGLYEKQEEVKIYDNKDLKQNVINKRQIHRREQIFNDIKNLPNIAMFKLKEFRNRIFDFRNTRLVLETTNNNISTSKESKENMEEKYKVENITPVIKESISGIKDKRELGGKEFDE